MENKKNKAKRALLLSSLLLVWLLLYAYGIYLLMNGFMAMLLGEQNLPMVVLSIVYTLFMFWVIYLAYRTRRTRWLAVFDCYLLFVLAGSLLFLFWEGLQTSSLLMLLTLVLLAPFIGFILGFGAASKGMLLVAGASILALTLFSFVCSVLAVRGRDAEAAERQEK